MAHELGKMFYYGETPWRKLGKCPSPATVEEARRFGEFDPVECENAATTT